MSQDVARTEIGPNSVVVGEIDAQEDVVVFGRVEGTIRSTTNVIIEEGGTARATIHSNGVLIAGVVIGDVQATERVEVTEKGRVLGDLTAPRLVLQSGGAVKGKVTMTGAHDAVAPARTAAPQGTRPYSYRQPGQVTAPATGSRKTAPAAATKTHGTATARTATRATATHAKAPAANADGAASDEG